MDDLPSGPDPDAPEDLPSDQSKPVKIGTIAHARSGDKGDRFNVGVIAWTNADYHRIKQQLPPERVAEYFGEMIHGEVVRYQMPNIRAFNFVCMEALDGGGQASLRYDTQGKTYGAALLEMELPPLEE